MSIPQSGRGPIGSRDDLVRYLEAGCKPKADWRIGTEHEKFVYDLKTMKPVPYEGRASIRALLDGMRRFGWEPVMEGDFIIGLTQNGASISLEPGGQFELSGAPLKTVHQTCSEVNTHQEQIREIAANPWSGLVWRDGETIRSNLAPALIKDLDADLHWHGECKWCGKPLSGKWHNVMGVWLHATAHDACILEWEKDRYGPKAASQEIPQKFKAFDANLFKHPVALCEAEQFNPNSEKKVLIIYGDPGVGKSRLAAEIAQRLSRVGMRAVRHRRVPPNDGGIAFGQLAVSACA